METTFTERDKKLLYLLGFIVIFFIFGWIIIRPMIRTIQKTEESIAAAEELKAENESKVMGIGSARTIVDRFETDLEAAAEEYYTPMDSSEIDKLFTMYVLGFGLRAKDLLIAMPVTTVDEVPYTWSDAAGILRLQAKQEEETDSTELAELTEEEDSLLNYIRTPLEIYTDTYSGVRYTTASGVSCARVTIVMTGSTIKEQKLLDDILTRPSLRVTGFAWDDLAPVVRTLEDGTVRVTENSEKQLTIRLNLYMYDASMAGIETKGEKE